MSQSLSDIIVHVVFSTKDREPWIERSIEEELYRYIAGVSRHLDSTPIQINGLEDHIHILLQLGRTISISDLVSEIKSSSSRWIKTKGNQYHMFAWQAGYGAFSVSRPSIDGAIKYIATQKEHHKQVTFKDEFVMMLQRAQIPYNETYLWQ